MNLKTRVVANILNNGGVVSLPTDTIQGLSCLPFDKSLIRLIELKQRSANKGLILISSNINHFKDYVEDIELLKQIKPSATPTTYLVKASSCTSNLLLGGYDTIAIRLTDNPLIKQLCAMTNSALVTTSANISGHHTAQSILKLQVYFKGELDYIIAPNKNTNNPSSIINLHTGKRLR
jgi:L-threonylcarbamoyladenylate synthase